MPWPWKPAYGPTRGDSSAQIQKYRILSFWCLSGGPHPKVHYGFWRLSTWPSVDIDSTDSHRLCSSQDRGGSKFQSFIARLWAVCFAF